MSNGKLLVETEIRKLRKSNNRILFINDLGFQYGAGVAQARQIEAILQLGAEVAAFAWEPGGIEAEVIFSKPVPSNWLGMRKLRHLDSALGLDEKTIIEGIVIESARFRPDLIVVGNLHGANWPISLLTALTRLQCHIAVYLHDCYYMTGRCPYPGQCISFKTGCKDDCPTANEYPSLEPSKIYEQWKLRRKIFTPGNLITVLANSEWTRLLFQLGLPSIHDLRTLYLGADEAVFRPGDKRTAKRRLGVPLDKPLVLCAAVNFTDPRKGSDFIQEIISQLGDKCTFAAFGHSASIIPGLVGLGYFINPKDIAHIFQAADVFIGTATEEAFGQTILEAQLTGCPVVAFRVGGVGEIVHHGVTGYLVEKGDTDAFTDSIKKIISNTNLCLSMCEASRKYAMRNYSISAHAARWELLIDDLESNKFNCVHSWTKSLLGLFRRYANRNRSFF